MNTEQEHELASWEASFRSAAEADGSARLAAHLHRFGLEVDPNLLIEGTIDFVWAVAAFATIDGRSVTAFLASQKYEPIGSDDATYALTFDVCGQGFARVLSDSRLKCLDLADLYGMPWDRLQAVGYSSFWVSRIDGDRLNPAELERLEQDVIDDLRFDHDDEELDIWFDADTCDGAMLVTVQDRDDAE